MYVEDDLQSQSESLELRYVHGGGGGRAHVLHPLCVHTAPGREEDRGCADMAVDGAPVCVDPYRLWLGGVVFPDSAFGGWADTDGGRCPPWWYHVWLSSFQPVELHGVLVRQDTREPT